MRELDDCQLMPCGRVGLVDDDVQVIDGTEIEKELEPDLTTHRDYQW